MINTKSICSAKIIQHILTPFIIVTLIPFFSCSTKGTDIIQKRLPIGKCTPIPQGDGWINLFSKENQTKWQNVTNKDKKYGFEFSSDDILHIFGSKGGGYIAYLDNEVTDFEFHIEFKLTPQANSGVFFRSDLKDPVQKGFEIQVFEDYGQPPNKNSCGSLYDVATPMFNMNFQPGEWNSYDITCRGSNLIVSMNGWKVLDVDISLMTMPIGKFDTPLAQLPQKGYLLLQDHGGEVWYRNAYIKNINSN
ncbi:MAG TPA: DUF1080 domain-containing protein [Candidatus Hydrogenedens sp.]|nr:DUF1080 domain-containing protein [Candidatus Hydrogenedens sp.]HOK08565.1 DUF1080 domain-containing protein [Candidatus Hydrogenedens sp.]HOL19053.1 DUF1080 domain-containing protein [Candidatus Hydrogenedens sp.]HPP57765.1 DUF1080 domain-containing protein [Candidatus Hydrogenedens sp.]